MSVYDYVTERIVKKLEEGTVPWRKPWVNGLAMNWFSERPYSGINTILLDAGEYATYNQITKSGGKIKKEERKNWHMVVFWKMIEKKKKKEDPDSDKKEYIPMLRYYKVYEINQQCEGLTSKRKDQTFEHDPVQEAEEIVKGYMGRPDISYASGKAVYHPFFDRVSVPPMKDYPNVNEFYSTLFHELVHSTGHKSRLNREGIQTGSFGDKIYSKEELIAEIGAAMLCGKAGIDNSTIDNSAAYINSWMRKIKDEPKLIVNAAASAQKAADHILGEAAEERRAG